MLVFILTPSYTCIKYQIREGVIVAAVGVTIVGVGITQFGNLPGRSVDDLATEAALVAMQDAGLDSRGIDGIVGMRVSSYEAIASRLGIESRWTLQVPAEGRMTGPAIQAAVNALTAGQCSTVLIAYGNDGRSGGHTYGGQGAASSLAGEGYGTAPELTRPTGLTSPSAFYAMMLERHRAEYGTSDEELALVATTFREHARMNPSAVMRKPMSVEDYLSSRFIVRPMRLFDYCLVNDGAVALVLTTEDRAADLPGRQVYVRGVAQAGALRSSDYPPSDYWRAQIHDAGTQVLRQTGINRDDVDVLMAYDNFSPNVLFALEGLGYCQPGESGKWIGEGRIGLGGQLPVNTSGGHLSESYMQGWGLLVEAVRQLRGDCGERQVHGAKIAQYIAPAPIVSSILLSSEAK